MKTVEKRPLISGFCGRDMPPESHQRCRMSDCACLCPRHTAEREPDLWEGDQA